MKHPIIKLIILPLAVVITARLWLGPLPPVKRPTTAPTSRPSPRVATSPSEAMVRAMDATWAAVCRVESDFGLAAYNPAEQAAGIAQIRPICLIDANRIVCQSGGPVRTWTMADRYDPAKARAIFATYTTYYAGGNQCPQAWARIWNGGPTGMAKPATLDYWRRVRAAMGAEL